MKSVKQPEQFRPVSHTPSDTLFRRVRFQLRLLMDFQVSTVYKHIKQFQKDFEGKIVDVGCGLSPYKHLFSGANTRYYGIDIYTASDFGYQNKNISYFDGKHIPFEDNSVDGILCTEVLEHVESPEKLIKEMRRILKPKGKGLITVPWSARFHYQPYDYYRFTPSMLSILFKDFSLCDIDPRGTDMTVIISKIVVAYFRDIRPRKRWNWLPLFLLKLLIGPVIFICILWGHLSLLFSIGSKDDPLGYTIWVKK